MKALTIKRKDKVHLISLITYIPLVANVIFGLFFALGYYYIDLALGVISLGILLKDFIISSVKKQRIKQANMEECWEREENEFEALLNKAKNEANAAVEIQLNEQYNEQLKKVIYNVLLDNNIINASLAKKIERILSNNRKKDFISDEELYVIVERTLFEQQHQKSV